MSDTDTVAGSFWRAERLPDNPILTPQTPGYDRDALGANINGPSLIQTPSWLPNSRGRYYLYFANHSGKHIRLAYADDLQGPWRMHEGGTLQLEQTPCAGHIASPDVHVDHDHRQIRLYYHGPTPAAEGDSLAQRFPFIGNQRTHVAVSRDGLHFEHLAGPIASPYGRAWRWQEQWYLLSMPALFQRAADGIADWTRGPVLLDENIRHSAVHLRGSTLHLFFSRAGDKPERILHATVDLQGDWTRWRASRPTTLLRSETHWEGARQPIEVSRRGAVSKPVHQLRDPGIYVEDDRLYLLYTVAGEAGIAIARLHPADAKA